MSAQSSKSIPASSAPPRAIPAAWFAVTTLLGAFLVFQVQPVISKCVLPWFGGTPAVWTTCMLFFQILLFCGYLYAHLLKTFFRPALQGVVHLILLAAAAWSLPIEPSDAWKPTGTESPIWHLLSMLAVHVGLPYFVLSSTGPLVQSWMSYRDESQRVYRLYALSNAGSLGALVSYPFLVEPVLSVSSQSVVWSLMFCLFVLVQGVVAISLFRVKAKSLVERAAQSGRIEPVTLGRKFLWVALPALASTMLLVVTNHVCQDVAVIPFLWVLPLSLYLLSFIICFDSPLWYRPKVISAITLVSIVGIEARSFLPGSLELVLEASAYMAMLAGVCLLCHGEVARLKPPANRLTEYYALLSAGGAIGGIIVAIACPLLLSTSLELPLTLAIVTSLTFVLFFACRGWGIADYDWSAAYRLRFGAIGLAVAPLAAMALAPKDQTIASERNFFGVLQVLQDDQNVRLVHGSTIHGMQRRGEDHAEPTTYYGRDSGIGRVIESMQAEQPGLRIGVVGLGCGVLATYGREQDQFDMIEINPAVVSIAERHFRFLSDCPSRVRHHLGDGRLLLERMTDARFDLLILDAFSSDAIPAHLLTREAMQLYSGRLARGGVLAIHVSNNHLDLVPLVHRLGQDSGWESRVVRSSGDPSRSTKHATWMILGDQSDPIWTDSRLAVAEPAGPRELVDAPLWTDQHHNLVSVLRLW